MKKILLFIVGIIALMVLIANLGPLVLLGLCIWLLYVVFKKFVKSESIAGKIGWVILGILIVSIGLSNIYAVIGIAAAYILYLIVTNWKNEKETTDDDPFKNFEQQWGDLNKY